MQSIVRRVIAEPIRIKQALDHESIGGSGNMINRRHEEDAINLRNGAQSRRGRRQGS
ncbi:MAG: hypothetical protein ACK4KV_03090 [Rhodocyclaceae bacterium]